MPASKNASYRSYYQTNAECWDLYTEVLAAEYSNAFLFGQVHQLTVDSYAVQHAGEPHPDKSVDVHLSGLYLGLVKGIRSPIVYLAVILDAYSRKVIGWELDRQSFLINCVSVG
jgi:Family of unknown function (DUF5946)